MLWSQDDELSHIRWKLGKEGGWDVDAVQQLQDVLEMKSM